MKLHIINSIRVQKVLLLIYFIVFTISGNAQVPRNTIVKGTISDVKGNPIPFVSIGIKNTGIGTTTNQIGKFSIELELAVPAILNINCLGFEPKQVLLKSQSSPVINLNEILTESTQEIDEIVIAEKSGTTKISEQAFTVSAIDAKPLQIENLDVNQILGRVSGVRIREEGGLGSGFTFSLNGFTGKQVKFFLDGIPMDNFGSSLSLNNIPVNMISGIEVYKGVVPIHLASDALGGAVNITTDKKADNFLNTSYSLGSFNTHRASVLTGYTSPKTGIKVNTNLFYNYSDNSYTMRNMEVIAVGNTTGKADVVDVERFHDAYESKAAQVEVGVVNKAFADKFSIGVTVSSNENEIQHGYNMNQVYGQAHERENVVIPTLKYKKSDFFIPGLNLTAYGMYIKRESTKIDTCSNTYNWYGDVIKEVVANHGEFSYYKTLLTYDDNVALVTGNLNYRINSKYGLAINNTYHKFSRKGVNPLVDDNFTPFYNPNVIAKNILSFAFDINLFNDKLKSTLFYKMFMMDYNTIIKDEITDDYEVEYDENLLKKGAGIAVTYSLTNGVQLKTSYENTFRLPEGEEIFGNGLTIKPNTSIKPESSNNINTGIMLNKRYHHHTFRFEGAYLYRTAKNYIRQNAANPTSSSFINDAAVKLTSIELSMDYKYKSILNTGINVSKQNNINNDEEDRLYGDRLPNQPSLFANGNIVLQFKDVVFKESNLSISWNTLFVDKFYWKWPSQGAIKFYIPQQLSHNIAVSYSLKNGRYNVSAACNNLTNNLTFDNFNMQKPGRAFNVKLNYYLSNK